MRPLVLTIILHLVWLNSFSQAETSKNKEIIFTGGCLEYPPKYRGGQKAMVNFISRNMNYPKEAEKKSIEGKVIIQFIVDTFGRAKNAKIYKGICSDLDNEALRLTNLLNSWTPATQNGKKINSTQNLPFIFMIDKGKIKSRLHKKSYTAANNILPKVRFGHLNIGWKSLSSVVRAGQRKDKKQAP